MSNKKDRQKLLQKSRFIIHTSCSWRHLKLLPYNKMLSICNNIFSEASKTFNSYLKHPSSTGKIAGTIHKIPLTTEIVQKANQHKPLHTQPLRVTPNCMVFHFTASRKERKRKSGLYEKIDVIPGQKPRVFSAKYEPTRNPSHKQKPCWRTWNKQGLLRQ